MIWIRKEYYEEISNNIHINKNIIHLMKKEFIDKVIKVQNYLKSDKIQDIVNNH